MRHVTSKEPVRVTSRDTGSGLAVLIRATPEQCKAGKYDGGSCGIELKPQTKKTNAEYWANLDLFRGKFSQPVVVVGGSHLPFATAIVRVKASMGAKRWSRYIASIQLRDAFEIYDRYGMRIAVAKLRGVKHAVSHGEVFGDWRVAHAHLPWEFGAAMKAARLTLWWNMKAKRLEPAVFCKNIETAMYALAAIRDLRACQACDRLFIPDRPDMVYCSIRCRERFRQQRRRSKLKGERGGTL